MDSILQSLYDSEINFEISTFWDGGFDWKLGDRMNGYKEDGNRDTFNEAVFDIAKAAIKHYPDSKFAKCFINKTKKGRR
jgi:hypothetical protein